MSYSIVKNSKGRYVVTSEKGKVWKTTYASKAAAQKGIAYVEGRFGGGTGMPASTAFESPDTSAERAALGISPKKTGVKDPEAF